MLGAGFDQREVEMARNRPSGDGTRFIGRPPTVRWRPAGAIRQPLGGSVTPSPLPPGHTGAVGPRWASGETAATITTAANVASTADPRIGFSLAGVAMRPPCPPPHCK